VTATFLSPSDPAIAGTLERDGVVFLDGLLDSGTVADARRRLEEYERDVLPAISRSHHVYQADGVTLHQYRDVERFSPWFNDLINQRRTLGVVAAAVPWEPMPFYLEVFPKPPGAHGACPHQDLYTVPVDPPQFVHLWIPLEDVGEENGGICFYPGTHRLGLAPHVESPGSPPTVDPDVMERLRPYRLQAHCPAGSGALFGGDMIHHSGPNNSVRSRPALVIGYRGVGTSVNSEAEILVSSIARFYREALGLRDCGPDDGFDALGGTREQAAGVVARLRVEYDVEVPVDEIFRNPTPRALAGWVRALGDQAST
jgi:ectoine hydroxylase-related dioxygenase (phytanoyl-CoA dioxygenase family)